MSDHELVPNRECGDCNVCCVALTIDDPALKKVQGYRCPNTRADKSCAIYDARPATCSAYFCGWRRLKWVRDTLRPDISGVLVDLQYESADATMGVAFTLLTNAALKAEGLAESVAAAVAAQIPVYLRIPGPPGYTFAQARINDVLRPAVATRNKAATATTNKSFWEHMTETHNHADTIGQILYATAKARARDLLAAVVQQQGWQVQAGPFAGMTLSDRVSWGDGDTLPKLLGFYEAELHETILDLVAATPDLIVNIGAAEGYYAVGLARLLPDAFVHAFDTASAAQDACRHTAALNDVTARISVAGSCTPELLQALLPRGRHPLVICDAEGYEKELLQPARVPALRTATMLIECHDYLDPSITPLLAERLQPTHDVIGIREAGRDPNAVPAIQGWASLDRWLAVCEFRPTMMHWAVAKPKTTSAR